MSIDFDVVVIGGGPSGLSTAYFLAKYGFNVLVLERGSKLGSKNVFGGRVYSYPFDKYFPGWRDELDMERWVSHERLITLCKEDSIELTLARESSDKYKSFTIFLSKLLEWMGERVESEGGVIATGVKADKIIFEDNVVSGVEAGGDVIKSLYVVFAEGVNSVLAEEYKLKSKPSPDKYAVGVKEVFKVDRSKINNLFGLDNDSGVAAYILGGPLKGVRGGGFIYTMRDYISLGVVVHLNEAFEEVYPRELIEDLRLHPYMQKIFKDATLIEYSARLVSEAGLHGILEKPYGNGYLIVGDSAGYVLNTGFTVRGVDYAVLSGKYAADAIKYSHENGSRESKFLAKYIELVKSSPIYRGLKKFKDIDKALSDRYVYSILPGILCRLFNKVYSTGEEPYKLYDSLIDSIKSESGIINLIYKLITLGRSI